MIERRLSTIDSCSFSLLRTTTMSLLKCISVRACTLPSHRLQPRSSVFAAKHTVCVNRISVSMRRFCTTSQSSQTEPTQPPPSRWAQMKLRFKEKKTQMMVEYGSTFIFLHEFFGIMSYVTVFTLLRMEVIPVETLLGVFGWTEADLMTKFGIDIHGMFTTWALTYAVVKGLDALGLVPFRWFLTITLTPRVAWWLGPKVDKVVALVKRLFSRNSDAPSTKQP